MDNWKDSIKKQDRRVKEKTNWKEERVKRHRQGLIDTFFEDYEIQDLQLLHKVFNLLQDNEGYRLGPLGEILNKMQVDAINHLEKVENPKFIKRAKELIEKDQYGAFEDGVDGFIEELESKYNIAIY